MAHPQISWQKFKNANARINKVMNTTLPAAVGNLLKPVTTLTTYPVSKFVVAQHFRESETVDGVRYSRFSGDFSTWLCRTEVNVLATELHTLRLLYDCNALQIGSAINPNLQVMFLAQIFQLLARQGDGREGNLLTGWRNAGLANLFLIRDDKGSPFVIDLRCADDGWLIEAQSPESSEVYYADSRITVPILS
jgi:hypothetical protein